MNVTSTTQLAMCPTSLGLLFAFALVAVAGYVLMRWISGRPIPTARRIGLLAIRLADGLGNARSDHRQPRER